ncbi:hypothetical protein GF386_06205 [Candidatus Pacearchaeota archaeon]|nr:hypothetical protein [Candidatus Pacearchaeota archaeon]MBD3283681.1 hypothetical protein [Candidatus Pacearchaeota archaeon]
MAAPGVEPRTLGESKIFKFQLFLFSIKEYDKFKFNVDSLKEEERFALLFGILLGDGCLSCYPCKNRKNKTRVILITGNKIDDKPFFEKVLIPLLKSLIKNSVKIKERIDQNIIDIPFFDKGLFNKLSLLGFLIGKKGASLFVPKDIYDKDLLRYVTQGFMATDGSLVLTKNPNKYYPRIEGNGISPILIRQITDYLIGIGMNGYFYEAKRNFNKVKWRVVQQQFRFQFNGLSNVLLFEEKIGFINPKHRMKFLRFLEYSKEYDSKIRGISSKKQKRTGENVNEIYYPSGSGGN